MATHNHQNLTTSRRSVDVTKKVLVHPKTHLPGKILSLSNLDRQSPKLMYLVFFYKQISAGCVFDGLKSGLEETLSAWYLAAGRLCSNPSDGKLNLWCNGEGAVLVEAVTEAKICELGDVSQYDEFFDNLVYKPVFNEDFSDMPLVVAQVTKFGCGGCSVGIGASHSLFDGQATYQFLTAWAANSSIFMRNGASNSNSNSDEVLHKPVHERGSLLLDNTNASAAKSHSTTTRAAAIDHLLELISQAVGDEDQKKLGGDGHVLKTFHVNGAMIHKLKDMVSGGCSSFDLLAAHLWKARTRALGVKKERMVCLQFAVNVRNRMEPPLPNSFSGNAYLLASVALKAGELEDSSMEAITKMIKQAKDSVNNDYVNAYMRALDEPAPPGGLPALKELTLISDWTRTPFHKLDFLQLGPASYASPLLSPYPDVAFFMQSPVDSAGIDVQIRLLEQTLDAFSRFFLPLEY